MAPFIQHTSIIYQMRVQQNELKRMRNTGENTQFHSEYGFSLPRTSHFHQVKQQNFREFGDSRCVNMIFPNCYHVLAGWSTLRAPILFFAFCFIPPIFEVNNKKLFGDISSTVAAETLELNLWAEGFHSAAQ